MNKWSTFFKEYDCEGFILLRLFWGKEENKQTEPATTNPIVINPQPTENPSYGEKIKSGIIKPLKLIFSQSETYVLYKELMRAKGRSIAQLKPVTVIDNETQRNFFFTLTEDFEEIKRLLAC